MTFKKYLISARPGNEVRVGGKVALTWCTGGLAASSRSAPMLKLLVLVDASQELLNGSCKTCYDEWNFVGTRCAYFELEGILILSSS